MSLAPWDADRPLTAIIVSDAIGECFPMIDAREVVHLGSGWEFDAWRTRDDWVFRFPRRAEGAELFASERGVHEIVVAALPSRIRIPRVELLGRPTVDFPYAFAGHRFIPGVPTNRIDDALLPTLAQDLGVALGAIHGIPGASARNAGVPAMGEDEEGRIAWLGRGMRRALALTGLDPLVDDAVRWMHDTMHRVPPVEGLLQFVHQDLSPEHLLVDPRSGALTGIIDWTDAQLGDAARDFVPLVTAHGWQFAEEVIVSYPHPVDRKFRERLGYMARLLSVVWLSEAHERQSDVAKHVRWVHNAFAQADTA